MIVRVHDQYSIQWDGYVSYSRTPAAEIRDVMHSSAGPRPYTHLTRPSLRVRERGLARETMAITWLDPARMRKGQSNLFVCCQHKNCYIWRYGII